MNAGVPFQYVVVASKILFFKVSDVLRATRVSEAPEGNVSVIEALGAGVVSVVVFVVPSAI